MSPSSILLQHPPRLADLGGGVRVGYRESGTAGAVTHVLLHGIGSGAGSWAFQLQAAAQATGLRALAWDAPGYGESTPLEGEAPDAGAYATRLWQWLDSLGVQGPVTLVGHSLGCIMAARAALQQAARVQRLVLLSPARGYGQAPLAERQQKLQNRLAMLARLGPVGMARERGAAMLSASAAPELVEAVRDTMARVHVGGYTQATRLLDQADLGADLVQLPGPVRVASGHADTITPPAACQAVARSVGQDWQDLGPVGHACPLEAAAQVNALIGLR
ncbi:alpha/beta fold hydrolase [Hydrogenophaga electricum]|uniref:Alpha/beta hydrolase n=1 Tax=Hydrogenophaga electricum TaxID=1230953 RepID=A0ABQ6C5B3_9BURK|nr:alpha/beta fold hydrolase [Hydrogenophaga electricum]GLS15513.1 alpha/beta hydrolase [Hydrogenophaga electricum]